MKDRRAAAAEPIRYLFILQSPEYKERFAKLAGQGIRLGEAAAKYGLHRSTLWRWVRYYNLIPLLNENEDGPMELDESFVAYCAAIYLRDGYRTSGKKLFDDIGRPKHSSSA